MPDVKHTIKTEINVTEMVKELFQNLPECSISLSCVDWKYNDFIFKFIDEEEGKKYTINLESAERGFKKFLDLVGDGKLHFYGLNNLQDPCEYDADSIDAIVQCAIFGEVIYG